MKQIVALPILTNADYDTQYQHCLNGQCSAPSVTALNGLSLWSLNVLQSMLIYTLTCASACDHVPADTVSGV